ncbi:FecCD family ABC transporter permease [Ornithinimicrobium cavernae]|uniref:FecCD family ABC transporter permease n=1 Tax=Ornithinimicrobium cavernae TaxID=2666047 RepID=UPI001F491E13|nr:iron ABC transporter permease [Ornithinimicrobium cavernae]
MTVQTRPAPDLSAALGAMSLATRAVRRRSLVVLTGLLVLLLGLVAARVLLGDYTITIPDFVRIVTGADIPGASYILLESKLPRAVAGTLAGLALGATGATFQTMARNPLASPDVLGITLGCSAAAVSAAVLLDAPGGMVSLAALGGGAAVAVALVVLSGTHPGAAPGRMILVGIALAAMLVSVIHWVLVRADIYQAHEAMVWLTGSLNGVTWSEIRLLTLVVVVALPLLLYVGSHLQVVELGDDLASGLGRHPRATRTRAIALVVVLTAATTAVCGPIAFVAFLSGPTARRLLRGRPSLLTAGLVGAVIVVAADYLAAYALPGNNFPVGVVTGLAGAPFLLWLLATSRPVKETA